ncbi:hypothetical protein D081_1331 [Anaerovibrio sp. JC8]|nr:hypothetical protein D081_1331 [Anaerovibrio sp. JC8]
MDRISDKASVPPVEEPIAIRLHQEDGAEEYDSFLSDIFDANKKSHPWI